MVKNRENKQKRMRITNVFIAKFTAIFMTNICKKKTKKKKHTIAIIIFNKSTTEVTAAVEHSHIIFLHFSYI